MVESCDLSSPLHELQVYGNGKIIFGGTWELNDSCANSWQMDEGKEKAVFK